MKKASTVSVKQSEIKNNQVLPTEQSMNGRTVNLLTVPKSLDSQNNFSSRNSEFKDESSVPGVDIQTIKE